MNNTIHKAVCLVTFATLAVAFGAHGSGALDGSKWKVALIPTKETAAKGEKPFVDQLVFEDGKVTSTACQKYGFTASAYSIDAKPVLVNWKTEQTSTKQGVGNTQWSGSVQINHIEGKMIWRKADGTELGYTFSGERMVLDEPLTP
jgi:hypothetical protein